MQRITSNEQFEAVLKNRPEQTQTWLVDDAVTIWPELKPSTNTRQMNNDEVTELAAYLEVPKEELEGPFYVHTSLRCPHCGRATTFLDFVKTAVDAKRHDKNLMRDILCGRAGRWVAVPGTSEERSVVCVKCNRGRRIDYEDIKCEYMHRWYIYARHF